MSRCGAAKPSAKASSRVRSCSRLWVVPSVRFSAGARGWLRTRLPKAVVTECRGVVRVALQPWGVVEGPAGGVVGHPHAGQLAQQVPGQPPGGGGRVPRHRRGHQQLAAQVTVYSRGMITPPAEKEVGPHLGPQHGDVGAGGLGLGLEGGKEPAQSKLECPYRPMSLCAGSAAGPGRAGRNNSPGCGGCPLSRKSGRNSFKIS